MLIEWGFVTSDEYWAKEIRYSRQTGRIALDRREDVTMLRGSL
jgi:hypothetical protein